MIQKNDLKVITIQDTDIQVIKDFTTNILTKVIGDSFIRDNTNGDRNKNRIADDFTGAVSEFIVDCYLYGHSQGKQYFTNKVNKLWSNYQAGYVSDGNFDLDYLGFPIDVKGSRFAVGQRLSKLNLFVSKYNCEKSKKLVNNTIYIQSFVEYEGVNIYHSANYLLTPWDYMTHKIYITGWTSGSCLSFDTSISTPTSLKFHTVVKDLEKMSELDDTLPKMLLTNTAKKIIAGKRF
jgi:hypothetical protein